MKISRLNSYEMKTLFRVQQSKGLSFEVADAQKFKLAIKTMILNCNHHNVGIFIVVKVSKF